MKQNIEINVNVSHPVKEEPIETVETAFAFRQSYRQEDPERHHDLCAYGILYADIAVKDGDGCTYQGHCFAGCH